MDATRFRVTLAKRQRIGLNGPAAYHAFWDTLKEAAAPEHVGTHVVKGGFNDFVHCSCGWESNGYWDLEGAAWDEWQKHVADEMGLIPKQCPCGKKYVPANGEVACHELRPIAPRS